MGCPDYGSSSPPGNMDSALICSHQHRPRPAIVAAFRMPETPRNYFIVKRFVLMPQILKNLWFQKLCGKTRLNKGTVFAS